MWEKRGTFILYKPNPYPKKVMAFELYLRAARGRRTTALSKANTFQLKRDGKALSKPQKFPAHLKTVKEKREFLDELVLEADSKREKASVKRKVTLRKNKLSELEKRLKRLKRPDKKKEVRAQIKELKTELKSFSKKLKETKELLEDIEAIKPKETIRPKKVVKQRLLSSRYARYIHTQMQIFQHKKTRITADNIAEVLQKHMETYADFLKRVFNETKPGQRDILIRLLYKYKVPGIKGLLQSGYGLKRKMKTKKAELDSLIEELVIKASESFDTKEWYQSIISEETYLSGFTVEFVEKKEGKLKGKSLKKAVIHHKNKMKKLAGDKRDKISRQDIMDRIEIARKKRARVKKKAASKRKAGKKKARKKR